MDRLATIILEDLSLYKQCHHCKCVNLATNKYCHTCMFPELDPLSPSTIERLQRLADEEETVTIANMANK